MNNEELLQDILENQNEIKHLGYLCIIDSRTNQVALEISASGVSRKYRFKNIKVCLNKIIEIIQLLKRLEARYSSR